MNNKTTGPSEFQFIDWVNKQVKQRPEIILGIGDDAAVLSAEPYKKWVTAVDVITEGVHFDSKCDPYLIGRKALAINLSDIAAMAADPVAAFIGIVLPKVRDRRYAEEIYRGLFGLANEFNVSIAGGDTNSWTGGLVISVTVQGILLTEEPVLRSGANPGDSLFVTGALGGSLGSQRHLTFTPRIYEARTLVEQFRPTAMLDISDGLLSDVRHLATQSQVGVIIDAEQIPIHADVEAALTPEQCLKHALSDGEDFELLFSVDSSISERLLREGKQHGLSVTKIGVCTEKTDLVLQHAGQCQPLPEGGWSHTI